MSEIICVKSSNVDKRNKHWFYCKKNKLPYITVYHTSKSAIIDWDLWCIDIAYLRLNDETIREIDAYVNSLFANHVCLSATLHTGITGFMKVKKEMEEEVLNFVWWATSNMANWVIKDTEPLSLCENPSRSEKK